MAIDVKDIPTDGDILQSKREALSRAEAEKWNRVIREVEAVRKKKLDAQGYDWFDSCRPDDRD